jgi:hypothetical protein
MRRKHACTHARTHASAPIQMPRFWKAALEGGQQTRSVETASATDICAGARSCASVPAARSAAQRALIRPQQRGAAAAEARGERGGGSADICTAGASPAVTASAGAAGGGGVMTTCTSSQPGAAAAGGAAPLQPSAAIAASGSALERQSGWWRRSERGLRAPTQLRCAARVPARRSATDLLCVRSNFAGLEVFAGLISRAPTPPHGAALRAGGVLAAGGARRLRGAA